MKIETLGKKDGKDYKLLVDGQNASVVIGESWYQFIWDVRGRMWQALRSTLTWKHNNTLDRAALDAKYHEAMEIESLVNEQAKLNTLVIGIEGKKYQLEIRETTAYVIVNGKTYTFVQLKGRWEVYRRMFDTTGTRITGMGVEVTAPVFPDGIPELAFKIADKMNAGYR